jgi:hypothetical protein
VVSQGKKQSTNQRTKLWTRDYHKKSPWKWKPNIQNSIERTFKFPLYYFLYSFFTQSFWAKCSSILQSNAVNPFNFSESTSIPFLQRLNAILTCLGFSWCYRRNPSSCGFCIWWTGVDRFLGDRSHFQRRLLQQKQCMQISLDFTSIWLTLSLPNLPISDC